MTDYAFDVRNTIQKWNDDFVHSALFHFELEGQLVVAHYWPNALQNVHRLNHEQKLIYDACVQIRGESFLFKLLKLNGTLEQMQNKLSVIVKPLITNKIMIQQEAKYLSLAVSINNGFFPSESI